MRFIFIFIFVFSFFSLFSKNIMQESATAPSRTPEQEAIMQTHRITEELDLSKKQTEAIYEINLKHARERQISNSRAEALDRSRAKNEAIQQILTSEQYDKLQNRRINRRPGTSLPQRANAPTPNLQRRSSPKNKEQTPERRQPTINNSFQRSSSNPNQRRLDENIERKQVRPRVQPLPQQQESSKNRPPTKKQN